MTSRSVAGIAVVAATVAVLAGVAGPGVRAYADGRARPVAMREIVHIQAVTAPARFIPANDGTIIVQN
jgi:hypothetical protein